MTSYKFNPLLELTKFPKITYKMYKTESSLCITFARVYIDKKYNLAAIVNSKKSDKSYNIILLDYTSINQDAKKWSEILNLEERKNFELGEELVNKMKMLYDNPNQEYTWFRTLKHKAKPKPGIYDKSEYVTIDIIEFY